MLRPHLRLDARPPRGAVGRGKGVAEHLDQAGVVEGEDARHEVAERVVGEVARHVGYLQPFPHRQPPSLRVRERAHPQAARCERAVLRVTHAHLLGELRGHRVRHHVERLHTGELPERHLPPNVHLQLQQEPLPVGPVAHALQRVHQVGEGLHEVRPQRQRPLVPHDGLLVPVGILIHAGQVGVRLGAARLQLHHVLIARAGLRHPPLKLEHAREVVVCHNESLGVLRAVQGLQGEARRVAPDGLVDLPRPPQRIP
mmetsp:Transcript_24123/g.75679  ORF Transcript_24123/g.75679 Transcript_24123/m.75679 type:complete len:256 (+) Transcript_24123:1304-2071(+)